MKKILAAVMVLAGGAAFAQVDATEVGPAVREGARDVSKSAKENTRELGQQAGLSTEAEGTFKEAKAFDIQGDVKEGGRGEITIARQGLPDAVLDIRGETKVMVDGKKADASAIKQGMKVDAKFQLEGEETVAVHVKAKSQKGMGGAGEAGSDDKDSIKQNAEDAWTEGREATEDSAAKAEDKAEDLKK